MQPQLDTVTRKQASRAGICLEYLGKRLFQRVAASLLSKGRPVYVVVHVGRGAVVPGSEEPSAQHQHSLFQHAPTRLKGQEESISFNKGRQVGTVFSRRKHSRSLACSLHGRERPRLRRTPRKRGNEECHPAANACCSQKSTALVVAYCTRVAAHLALN